MTQDSTSRLIFITPERLVELRREGMKYHPATPTLEDLGRKNAVYLRVPGYGTFRVANTSPWWKSRKK